MGRHTHRTNGGALRVSSDEQASIGIGSLIMFVAFMIAAVIISATIVQVSEILFSKSKSDAQTSTQPFNGIIEVIRLEIRALGGTDEISITFSLPFQAQPLPEDELSWVIMCAYPLTVDPDAVEFDQGQFEFATTLEGDGLTSMPLTEFEPATTYHMRIQLDACDLETISPTKITLVLLIDKGRTLEMQLEITSSPYVGMDLI